MAKRVVRRKRTVPPTTRKPRKEPHTAAPMLSPRVLATMDPMGRRHGKPVIEVRGKPFPTHCTRPGNPWEWAAMRIRPRNRPARARTSGQAGVPFLLHPLYGAVYPISLVAGLIPSENALVYGLLDGASDARMRPEGEDLAEVDGRGSPSRPDRPAGMTTHLNVAPKGARTMASRNEEQGSIACLINGWAGNGAAQHDVLRAARRTGGPRSAHFPARTGGVLSQVGQRGSEAGRRP